MLKVRFTDKIPPVLRNKYVLTSLIFAVWILLLDSSNLVARFREMRELRNLNNEKEYYLNKIEEDSKKLRELRTDDRNLEKFAREQYKMKRPDEDLYIVLTPHEDRQISRKVN
ncbi:MAG TPA: hypothetical protein PLV06_09995 [Bacteroidales bacterium]|nr:hypothetical protein [Bacteroidales bacterium]HPF03038.1 hypothetical protein [Bacteroidales bacterium]HPJ59848.1 hypothetical protein [Bacteroidales bacterium]HPR12704.1 hypothetical protein [Bacteroidales bacterium]HRW85574.1 hypothetical protein [Bacteroidales bacterium]